MADRDETGQGEPPEPPDPEPGRRVARRAILIALLVTTLLGRLDLPPAEAFLLRVSAVLLFVATIVAHVVMWPWDSGSEDEPSRE